MGNKIVIALIFLIGCTNESDFPVPKGYRLPNNTELSLPARDSSNNRFATASGDFNGDGFIDTALLVIDSSETELVLIVLLAGKSNTYHEYIKLESFNYELVRFAGIRTIKPKTVKIYQNIRNENKVPFNLVNVSIEFFQFEGSSSVYYYNTDLEEFKRVWTSK